MDKFNSTDKVSNIKRIHLIPRLNKGGAESTILNIVKHLGGNKNNYIACSSYEIISIIQNYPNIVFLPTYPSNIINLIRSIIRLYYIIDKFDIGIIHSHHRFTSLVGVAVSYLKKIPFVCTAHDLTINHRFISRIAYNNCVMVYSKAVQSHLVTYFGISPDIIHRISMGIEPMLPIESTNVFHLRKQLNYGDNDVVIGFAGRLDAEKGIDVFVNAIPDVLKHFPKTKFLIIGNGPMRKEMEALAQKLYFYNNVTFSGWQDDIYLYISCADIMVVPSLKEGFGKVALESLMLGKPVIASNVGGLPEFVTHEYNGLIIPPGKSTDIANAIIKLLSDGNLLHRLTKNTTASVSSRFSMSEMISQIKNIYALLCSHNTHNR